MYVCMYVCACFFCRINTQMEVTKIIIQSCKGFMYKYVKGGLTKHYFFERKQAAFRECSPLYVKVKKAYFI